MASKEIAAGKETAKDLVVQSVHPLAAKLDGVVSGNYREVVLDVGTP